MCALTETWLSADDAAVRAECLPAGYKIYDYPRTTRGGGGVAREQLLVSLGKTGTMRSFEFVELEVSCDSFRIRLAIIYRTLYSSSHPVMVSTFLDEFADYLESIVSSTEPLLITGDMNVHVDVSDNADAVKFRDLLESMVLTQHVRTSTHESGYTLDCIITRELDNIVSTTPISDCCMSDHCTVLCKLTDKKPSLLTKEVRYRKTINIESLKKDIQLTTLCLEPPEAIDDLMTCYETTLSDVLDKHARLIIKSITVRPYRGSVMKLRRQNNYVENVRMYGEEHVFHLIRSYLSKLVTVLFT